MKMRMSRLLSIIGAIVSILGFWLSDLWQKITAEYLILLIVIAVVFTVLHIKKIKKKTENLISSFTYVHQLIHDSRDLLQLKSVQNIHKNEEMYGAFLANAFTTITNNTQNMIAQAVGKTCYVNIMAPDQSGSLTVLWWSLNTPSGRRERNPPTTIPIGHGIAGKAFQDMEVYIVGDVKKFPGFIPRDTSNAEEPLPYISVISCPFRVDGVPAGVLNIDCNEKDAFEPEEIKFLVQAAADTVALIFQIENYIEILENALDEK